jgi:hypothetical protein
LICCFWQGRAHPLARDDEQGIDRTGAEQRRARAAAEEGERCKIRRPLYRTFERPPPASSADYMGCRRSTI